MAEAANSAEGSGKTIEAAVAAASARLGVSPDMVDVEVLAEPVPSTFGRIGSPARVRVTVRETPRRDAPVPVGVAASSGEGAGDAAASAPRRAPSQPRPPEEVDPELAAQQAELAGDFIEGLLELLDLEADITTWTDEAGGHVDVEGPDLGVLVGRDGDVLSALEELTRLAVVRASGERARVILDVDGFKQRRRQELVIAARAAAERVLARGLPEQLPPMTPFERKIVHDVIRDMDGVESESVGEEPNRRVTILPA